VPNVQLFDVISDESERHNLAESRPDILQELMNVVEKYNNSKYVEALHNSVPVSKGCPDTSTGVLIPCPIPDNSTAAGYYNF